MCRCKVYMISCKGAKPLTNTQVCNNQIFAYNSTLLKGLYIFFFHFASLLSESFVSVHASHLLLSSCSLSTQPHKRIL